MKNQLLTLVAILLFGTSYGQLSITTNILPISCYGGSDGMIEVFATGGVSPYTYTWVMDGSTLFVTTSFITNLPASDIFVYVTDNVGATVGDTIEMLDPPIWNIATTTTPATCGANDGTISLTFSGGTAPYTFQWNNGSTVMNPTQLSAGTYNVTITDANGCSYTELATVTTTGSLAVNTFVQYDSCQGTACIVASTVPNATYSWSNGAVTPQICGLPDGTYNVTVTGPSGCTGFAIETVVNATVLQAAATSTPASCGSDGSVISTATGGTPPYTYAWNTLDNTSTVSNLPAGNYTVTVSDVNGCSTTATTNIANGSFSLDSITVTQATCNISADATATLYVSGSNPPFSYTFNGTTGSNNVFTGLSIGTYSVTVTDGGGCILVQSFTVTQANLQVQTGIVQQSNCLTGQAGSLFATALNGLPPYNFAWSDGSITDTVANLTTGGYTVTVTDASGCSAVRHQFVTSAVNCRAKVMGKVYVDADSSCAFSTGDIGVRYMMVNTGGYNNGYTDINGNWFAYLDAGVYYVKALNIGNNAHLGNICGTDSITVTVLDTTTITGIDFLKTAEVPHNVGVWLNCGVVRPGFTQTVTANLFNYGYSAADGHGTVTLDPAFSAINSYAASNGIVIDSVSSTQPITLYYSYTGLPPQQNVSIQLYVQVPLIPTVFLGQLVTNSATVTLDNNTDLALDNNSSSCTTTVVGSYDPNDKQVFNANNESIDGPATIGDTLLRYLIRFQNTGTDTAFTVVIRDTLDEHLNVSSFRFIAASHNVEIEFYEERIVHFVFNNILLPDSNVNEPGSHGFVEFDIEVLNKTQLDEVSNQAAIYFDFNPPIYTNTVVTARMVGISETTQLPVHVFPNPTSGLLSVNIGGQPIELVEIYDLMGRKVMVQAVGNSIQAEIDATDLNGGVYIVRVLSGGSWFQERVVVAH